MFIFNQISKTSHKNYVILQNLKFVLSVIKKSTNIDVIDSFTNNLVEIKKQKWENIKVDHEKKILFSSDFNNKTIIEINSKSSKNTAETDINILESFILSLLLQRNFKELFILLDECIIEEKCLSHHIVLIILENLNKESNDSYHKKFIKYLNEFSFENDLETQHIIGEYYWSQGYIKQSIEILKECYDKSDSNYRIKVRKTFKKIVSDTIDKKSEAVLMYIITIGEEVLEKYNDFYIIAFIWQICFRSQWFSDQNISTELFEKHKILRELISERTNTISYSFLYDHNVEAVHRLIELYLKWKMKNECQIVLGILFEYYYWQKDVRACSSILRNCLDLDITLHQMYYEKLLSLMIGKSSTNHVQTNIITPKFKFKF